MLREEDITIQIKSQGYECKTYTANRWDIEKLPFPLDVKWLFGYNGVKETAKGASDMCSKETLNQMLEQMNAQLQTLFGSHLKNTILYGSYARGDADEESDVDVLVLVDLPREEIVRYRRPVATIASEYLFSDNVLIAPIIENQSFYEQHQAVLPFYRNIAREGVRIGA